jgi:hypothetical protein
MLASCIASVTFSTEELDAADEGCKDAGLESPPSVCRHPRPSLPAPSPTPAARTPADTRASPIHPHDPLPFNY